MVTSSLNVNAESVSLKDTFPLIHFCVIKHIPIFAQVKRKAKPKLVFSRY